MSKVGFTKISLGKPLKYEHRVEVNDFIRALKENKEIRTNMIEIFPGFTAQVVIRESDVINTLKKRGSLTNKICLYDGNGGSSQLDHVRHIFFLLELEIYRLPEDAKLAANVRVNINGEEVEKFKIGDAEKADYRAFSGYKLNIESKSYVKIDQYTKENVFVVNTNPNGRKEASTLELRLVFHHPGMLISTQEEEVPKIPKVIPKTLQNKETVNKEIMKDEETADLTLRCHNKKFRVHRNFLCNRSPVLRRMILNDREGKAKMGGEILIEEKEIDPETVRAMIHYIYTGELVGENLNVQKVSYAAGKYDMPGLMDLLCFKMKSKDIPGDFIADMLISADRHDSTDLKNVALDKLRANRDILNDKKFREKLQKAENKNILFDLFNEL